MARRYYNSAGADVSSTVQTFLLGGGVSGTVPMCDLFWLQYINPSVNSLVPTNLFLAGASYPVSVNNLQVTAGPNGVKTVNAVYKPTKGISRGAMNYEVGFKDQTCDITWNIDDSIHIGTLSWGFKHALVAGYFDEYPFWIHQAIFSDINAQVLIGTTLKWRGFIKDVKADRGKVIVTIASLLNIFQGVQIPSQVIQPGSRLPSYFPAGNASVVGGSLGGTFMVASTPMDLQFDTTASPFAAIADHALRDCYLTSVNNGPPNWKAAQSGVPFAPVFRIRDNVTTVGICHLYPYEPIDPVNMLGFPGGVAFINFYFQNETNKTGAIAPGFPTVPPPETGV